MQMQTRKLMICGGWTEGYSQGWGDIRKYIKAVKTFTATQKEVCLSLFALFNYLFSKDFLSFIIYIKIFNTLCRFLFMLLNCYGQRWKNVTFLKSWPLVVLWSNVFMSGFPFCLHCDPDKHAGDVVHFSPAGFTLFHCSTVGHGDVQIQ